MIPNWLNRWLPESEVSRARFFAVIAFIAGLVASPFTQFVVGGVLVSVQERATFPMLRAEIESYRRLPALVQCSPQVANTIAAWNARIAHEHESNAHLWSDYFSTDRWQAVDPIRLHCETELL